MGRHSPSAAERELEERLRRMEDAVDETTELDLRRIERGIDEDIERRIQEAEGAPRVAGPGSHIWPLSS